MIFALHDQQESAKTGVIFGLNSRFTALLLRLRRFFELRAIEKISLEELGHLLIVE